VRDGGEESPSGSDEGLHEIRDELPASTVQVNTVGMEAPSVSIRDLVETPAKHEEPKGI
jgi:hypothetical protein